MTLHEIKSAIAGSPPDEFSKLRVWFAEFDADTWNRQFEEDAAAGKLNALIDEALEDLRDGKTTDL